ncbi:MAG: hypothetical protein F6K17_13155 [Okeania sp. SIO3C4]|nr:hypothetical protein [Okeania sp. SIO3B3]NER03490.1 hypothetical protein [Okeania sp. SIO3C4]
MALLSSPPEQTDTFLVEPKPEAIQNTLEEIDTFLQVFQPGRKLLLGCWQMEWASN